MTKYLLCALGFVFLFGMHLKGADSEMHRGYERGVYQTAAYVMCAEQFEPGGPTFPSAAFRDKAWHSGNWDNTTDNQCWAIEAIRREVGETPRWDVMP